MTQLLTKIETTEEAISFFKDNVTEENLSYIEESLIMAKFKADLHLNNELFNALEWPLDGASYINYLEDFQKWIPLESEVHIWRKHEAENSQEVFDRLCHFYYLIDQQTGIGNLIDSIDWFSDFLAVFVENWGSYLNDESSFSEAKLTSYLKFKPLYRIQDSLLDGKPNKHWNTFNDFFARELNPLLRPIDSLEDNNIVTSPADGSFKTVLTIDANSDIDAVTLKQTHNFSSVADLLKGSKYADSFANGTFAHYVLEPYAYHRFHSPVSGLVKESYPFLDTRKLNTYIDEKGLFEVTSSKEGYNYAQSRGILTIDTTNSPQGDMGIVAIIPIGLCQASSVHLLATPDTVLDKGEEFGYFKFGGSDIILLFQEGKAPIIDSCKEYRNYGNSISTCPINKQ